MVWRVMWTLLICGMMLSVIYIWLVFLLHFYLLFISIYLRHKHDEHWYHNHCSPAGDHVKFGFPMASSATVLLWGFLQWPNAYQWVIYVWMIACLYLCLLGCIAVWLYGCLTGCHDPCFSVLISLFLLVCLHASYFFVFETLHVETWCAFISR